MRIAMDTGGTFTDCVFVRDGCVHILKVLSTPQNPARAIADALGQIQPDRQPRKSRGSSGGGMELLCGTTVGTNALLERRGARVALVTTAGFEDILEIARQTRPRLYDFFVTKPAPLVPRARRFGLRERVVADGSVLHAATEAGCRDLARRVKASGAQSIAVCLLFSFLNSAHERKLARILREAGLDVSVSHEILPEFREYERTVTIAVNAYLRPVMGRYLSQIEAHAREAAARIARPLAGRTAAARVRVMQSNGGICAAPLAAREPVRTVLSGPAGGVLGARHVARAAGFERVISFDMGGTSTDVALLDGPLATTSEAVIADLPIAVPMLEIHTVGAGGGSTARFDRAGALRVGPESAGADPGPICYGRGTRATVTDANLLLGRLPASGLLGGSFALDAERARRLMESQRGGIRSVEEFAQGIVDVANATMEKAIRVISVERGYDPRDYTLVAFGGAGALHACDLAAALDIPRVLVPVFPGALSALGILGADVVKELSRTVRIVPEPFAKSQPALRAEFRRLEREGVAQMREEGFAPPQVRIQRLLDLRYAGQTFTLTIPLRASGYAEFHRLHEQRYGYADTSRGVEVVNVRARFSGAVPRLRLGRVAGTPKREANAARPPAATRIWLRSGWHAAKILQRETLTYGQHFAGPAVVSEYSATTYLPRAWQGRVDRIGNLVLERRR